MDTQNAVAQPTVTTNNGIRKETHKGGITLDRIYVNEQFQKKGTKTAQIRQVVTTLSFYPERKVDSNLQQGLFQTGEFGFSAQEFKSEETRVAFIFIPEATSEEEVTRRIVLATSQGACIYKVLSNEPILDENQRYAVTSGLRTLDHFADNQAVRYPENEETKANGTANKLMLDKNGNVQYRRTFFWLTAQEDVDARNPQKVYLSANLKSELALVSAETQGASVLQGQTI